MKAVVVEIEQNLAVVLSDNGSIQTIKNKHYEIGQVIHIRHQSFNLTKKISIFAASAAAVLMLSVGSWAYASPYSYISVDVNPSIEFSVNRFDRVIHVNAVNDDGEKILDKISLAKLKNKRIRDALINTVDQISEVGYFDGNTEGGIFIATSSERMAKADELAAELKHTIELEVSHNGDYVEVEAISVTFSRVEEAKELGVTPGKLKLIEKLKEVSNIPDSIDTDKWLQKPVKDIMKAIKEQKKAALQDNLSKEQVTLSPEQEDKAVVPENKTKSNHNDKSAAKDKKAAKPNKSIDRTDKKLQAVKPSVTNAPKGSKQTLVDEPSNESKENQNKLKEKTENTILNSSNKDNKSATDNTLKTNKNAQDKSDKDEGFIQNNNRKTDQDAIDKTTIEEQDNLSKKPKDNSDAVHNDEAVRTNKEDDVDVKSDFNDTDNKEKIDDQSSPETTTKDAENFITDRDNTSKDK